MPHSHLQLYTAQVGKSAPRQDDIELGPSRRISSATTVGLDVDVNHKNLENVPSSQLLELMGPVRIRIEVFPIDKRGDRDRLECLQRCWTECSGKTLKAIEVWLGD